MANEWGGVLCKTTAPLRIVVIGKLLPKGICPGAQ